MEKLGQTKQEEIHIIELHIIGKTFGHMYIATIFSVNFKIFVYHLHLRYRVVCDSMSSKEVTVFGLLDDWVISALAAEFVCFFEQLI